MKETNNVTVFQCDFCKKKLFRKHAMVKHEDWCTYNPKNFSACSGCAFIKERLETIEIPSGSMEYSALTYQTKQFECTLLKKWLYPMKAVRKGIVEKYPETFEGQELMPNKCSHRVEPIFEV